MHIIITKMVQQELANIKNRIRKEARYSALATMTMRLLKKLSMFQVCQTIAKQENIKTQKNYSIIVLRLAIIYREMMMKNKHTKDELVEQICRYFRDNLMPIIERKYMKGLKEVKQMIYEENIKNIRVFQNVLLSDLNSLEGIKILMRNLYVPALDGNFTKQQTDSINRLSQILYRFTKKELILSSQKNQIEKETTEEHINNIDF